MNFHKPKGRIFLFLACFCFKFNKNLPTDTPVHRTLQGSWRQKGRNDSALPEMRIKDGFWGKGAQQHHPDCPQPWLSPSAIGWARHASVPRCRVPLAPLSRDRALLRISLLAFRDPLKKDKKSKKRQ